MRISLVFVARRESLNIVNRILNETRIVRISSTRRLKKLYRINTAKIRMQSSEVADACVRQSLKIQSLAGGETLAPHVHQAPVLMIQREADKCLRHRLNIASLHDVTET
jgi:hypothetical protein